MSQRADVVVVGLGALGSATAWQLARRGARVVALERFEPGHVRGASHGDSRIIRLSYHTPSYVRGAREAYEDWAELEADSGRQLVHRTGGVDVFPAGAAIALDDYAASMTAQDVPFEVLDAAATRRRFPVLAVPDAAQVLFQEQSGYVRPSLTVAALQHRALARGARLRFGCRVVELTADADGVRARCEDGAPVEAGAAVVTADAWTNEVLAGLDVALPLTVTKEQVVHFDVSGRAERHAPGAMPVWIWMDDPSYYGFPAVGEASVKLGQDCGGVVVDPETRDFEPVAALLARTQQFAAGFLPGAGRAVRVTTCLYTLTPDRDFVVSTVPGHENVVVGLGSAHGFKFAPWFGRVLADLATTGATSSDISAMAMDRPALTDPGAPPRWLV